MGEHRRGLTIALAVAAGMLATGGGLAIASKSSKTIPIGADGTITACAKQGDGRLRMVAKAENCHKHEQVVTWNQKGQAGGDAAPGDVVVGTLTLGATTVSIHSFSFGASNETVVSGGGGAGTGKVKVADVEVLKDIDDLTLDSTEGVFTGKHHHDAEGRAVQPRHHHAAGHLHVQRRAVLGHAAVQRRCARAADVQLPQALAHHRRAHLRVRRRTEQEGLTRAAPVRPHRADGRGRARAVRVLACARNAGGIRHRLPPTPPAGRRSAAAG